MTLWRNESQDVVKIEFDIGKGSRELITLSPGAEIELPAKLDKYVPLEAPQLQVVKPQEQLPVEQLKKKPGRKKESADGIQ